MTYVYHYTELGSDHHLYGISLFIPQTSFSRETSCGVSKCPLFPHASDLSVRKRQSSDRITLVNFTGLKGGQQLP